MGPQKKGITPEVMTAEEVCEYLKISRTTLYRLRKAGKIHGSKIGRLVLFKREDIAQMIENGMEG